MVNGLFGNFLTNFFYFFNDTEFEGGCEFTSDFLSNINSRLYLPGNEIVGYGEELTELVMIQESVVSLHLRIDKIHMYEDLPKQEMEGEEEKANFDFIPGQGPKMLEFFILPTYSYFGDYQILYGLRSQISFKAGDSN